jgi:hypothetical protein
MMKISRLTDNKSIENSFPLLGGARKAVSLTLALTCLSCTSAIAAADLSYLEGLLASTPEGGWVQVNTNKFSNAWPSTLAGGVPSSDPAAIVHAWSSFAWDSARGDLLLFGGGHANYSGNEMYVWQGADGAWTRGSLPSRMERYGSTATYFTVDNAAPQSSHTYDNNIYVPVNDMFVTFGGAAFNSGSGFVVKGPDGTPVPAGPWMWDPQKADPNKVGGTDGSGYLPSSPGGMMWSNQYGKWVGDPGSSYLEGTTAYRQENGHDVIYVTGGGGGGWPSLFRYELGNVRNGELGSFEQVAVAWNAPSFQGTSTIDSTNGLFIRTSSVPGFQLGFGVWDLAKSNAANPGANRDIAIKLVSEDGTAFVMDVDFGIDFDSKNGKILMWDGRNKGTIWETEATYDGAGNLLTTWVVKKYASTTASQPGGNFQTGVLGKWHYVSDLNAFVALDEYNSTTADAGVWLYKPFDVTPVPEPSNWLMLLAGLGVLCRFRAANRTESPRNI